MSYAVENRSRYLLVLYVTCAVAAGCASPTKVSPRAKSAVIHWSPEAVLIVADGSLPTKLNGWKLLTYDDSSLREIRIATPDTAEFILGRWASKADLRFALLDSTDQLIENHDIFSQWATLIAADENFDYVIIFVADERQLQLMSKLETRGLRFELTPMSSKLKDMFRALGTE